MFILIVEFSTVYFGSWSMNEKYLRIKFTTFRKSN